MKKVKWVYIPNAGSGMSLPSEMNISEAKKFVREFLGVSKLPKGIEFWL